MLQNAHLTLLVWLVVFLQFVSHGDRAVASATFNESVNISGELKTWHTVTLSLDGPFAKESAEPNPFLDFRFEVTFSQTLDNQVSDFNVPGYFAADGNSANSSANSGNAWQAKFTPPNPGTWNYKIKFVTGKNAAVDSDSQTKQLPQWDGLTGTFKIQPNDSEGYGFRSEGRLNYVNNHLLEFQDSGRAFFKVGPDSPETLLAYGDFDGTHAGSPRKAPLKTWAAHVQDWSSGDPTWQVEKGKGLIGALNYLSDQGLNSVSFLTYNLGGDGNNVWPHTDLNSRLRFDCSKLDQWQIVFEHASNRNLMLHFKLQETENDDRREGHQQNENSVPAALDGGAMGIQRKAYLRELVARFAHLPGLEWNIGEENTQSFEEQAAMANYLRRLDAYDNHIVLHTFPDEKNKKYEPHLFTQSALTGVSLQNDWKQTHRETLRWVRQSATAGKPWVACNDEQGKASQGVPPDPNYKGFSGRAPLGKNQFYDLNDIRKRTLWGNLMAGGGGVMYYFGYELSQNDLVCEDFRSREMSWKFCQIAKDFVREQQIPLNEMTNANKLVNNADNGNGPLCLAKENDVYLVYLASQSKFTIDLSQATNKFSAASFDPVYGSKLNSIEGEFTGGNMLEFRRPEGLDDWAVLLRKQ